MCAAAGGTLDAAKWPETMSDFNLLEMEKHIGAQPAGSTSDFNSWMFGVSYSNNFLHSFETMMCSGEPLKPASLSEQMALAPSKTGTTISVLGPGAGFAGLGYVTHGPFEPFYMLISGLNGRERVKVTAQNDCSPTPSVCQLSEWAGYLDNDKNSFDWTAETACAALTTESTCYDDYNCDWIPTDGTTKCRTLTIERDAANPIDFAKPPKLDKNVWDWLRSQLDWDELQQFGAYPLVSGWLNQ